MKEKHVSQILVFLISFVILSGIQYYVYVEQKEVSLYKYEEVTKWLTFEPEIKPLVDEAMLNNEISKWEYDSIKDKYEEIREKEHQEFVENQKLSVKTKLKMKLKELDENNV